MNLEAYLPGIAGPVRHELSERGPRFLVLRSNRLIVTTSVFDGDGELGRITFGPGGAKLEAVQTLHILPAQPNDNVTNSTTADPRSDKYVLEPASQGRREVILLRHGDFISSPGIGGSVLSVWRPSEVQVNSSAAEIAQGEPSAEKDGVADTPEDETEDEDAPDDTITEVPVTQPTTQLSKSQPSATPHLVTTRSVLVQETPTTSRILGTSEYDVAPSHEGPQIEPTPPPQGPPAVTEAFSIARIGQSPRNIGLDCVDAEPTAERKRPQGSPQVRVTGRAPRKRASPGPVIETSGEGPPAKRTKQEADIMQASPLDNINADPTRTTYSARKKRKPMEVQEATPTKSSRSSQRSVPATAPVAYEGEPPRVLTSNSAIQESSPMVKFLRKHGGALVSSVEDKCNVLCVRDGGLAKTMKVIQAIALGIPIVTDKWLAESAKAECFLDLSTFKPLVAQQEKEWGFSLEKVWGVAQTPFKGYAIYFTPALRKTYTNFREMEKACQALGAKVVAKRTSKHDKIIVLAAEEGDQDADQLIEDGKECYHKDLLTTSILRGNLDLESDEFKIKAKHCKGRRAKGPRKST